MNIALIGLSVIIIAWIIQLIFLLKGKKEINPLFVLVYIFGVLILIIDSLNSNLKELALFNLISLIAAAAVLITISLHLKKKKYFMLPLN